jgi:hypothetical protein
MIESRQTIHRAGRNTPANSLLILEMCKQLLTLVRKMRASAAPPRLRGERRQAPRYLSGASVVCRVAGPAPQTRLPAHVHDVSAEGIGLLSEQRFEPGTLLEVERPGTGEQAALLILSCVRHARHDPDRNWFLGCSFIRELSEQELHALL